MIIKMKDILDQHNLTGHLILNYIYSFEDIMEVVKEKQSADIRITVEGREIDFESFITHWQSQVGRAIKEKAVELLDEKVSPVFEKIENLKEELSRNIDKLSDSF